MPADSARPRRQLHRRLATSAVALTVTTTAGTWALVGVAQNAAEATGSTAAQTSDTGTSTSGDALQPAGGAPAASGGRDSQADSGGS